MTRPTLQPGNGDLPKLNLRAADGACAEIYLHGGHVTSWQPAGDAGERLFLSPKADFLPASAIRGGAPLIFPQFAGLGPLPKHGFARSRAWTLVDAADDWATLRLTEDPSTLALWPHPFTLDYTVGLQGPQLVLTLKVSNPVPRTFSFSAALHTYLRVDDLRTVSIHGLQGLRFSDSANGDRESIQSNELLTFPSEIDRIYFKAAAPVELRAGPVRSLLTQTGFTDVVTWNPGPEKCAALKDMLPDGYLQFVCIEAALIETPVTLAPGLNSRCWRIMPISPLQPL